MKVAATEFTLTQTLVTHATDHHLSSRSNRDCSKVTLCANCLDMDVGGRFAMNGSIIIVREKKCCSFRAHRLWCNREKR